MPEKQSPDPTSRLDFVVKYPAWPENTWVRKAPNDYAEGADGKLFFSPSLMPVLAHPSVVERGPGFARVLTVHRLYAYAGFTETLERNAVNPATLLIAEGGDGLDLPRRFRRAADEIYTEEAFHAQESNHIVDDVADLTGVAPLPVLTPCFLSELRRLTAGLPPAQREQALVAFSIVSETLISGILTFIPGDPLVADGVRTYVADHARDEGRHHRYFSEYLGQFWPSLDDAGRAFLAPLFPRFFRLFLDPDHGPLRQTLLAYGMAPRDVERAIRESYDEAKVLADIRAAAARSLVHFRRAGVLDDPRAEDAFAREGLL